MANAARMHAVEQGENLAECCMVAFGGNGALHAPRVAEKLGIDQIIVPPNPGVGSAIGFLYAPVAYEIVQSRHVRIDNFPFDEINGLLRHLESEAREVVNAGAPGESLCVRRIAFMRYAGQGHEIEIEIPAGDIDEQNMAALAGRFESEYSRLFTRVVPEMVIEAMNWSVTVSNELAHAPVIADHAETRR